MKAPTISVVFNRLGYKSKSGAYPISLKFYQGKADYHTLPNCKIYESEWKGDHKHEAWTRDHNLNQIIADEVKRGKDHVREQLRLGRVISLKELKDFYRKPDFSKGTFNDFTEDYICSINKIRKTDLALNTIKVYKSFLVKLNEFNPHIYFDMLRPELIDQFDRYLIKQCELLPSTRRKYLDKFAVIYKAAVKNHLVPNDPFFFDDIKITVNKPKRTSLSYAELSRWKNADVEDPGLMKYRDLFVLLCLTGMYYNDLKKLKKSNLVTVPIDDNGEMIEQPCLVDGRFKNEQRFTIRLSETAVSIIRRYSSDFGGSDLLIPGLISCQKFNDKLKEIAKLAQIDKNLTNKVGRHTYGELMVTLGNSREKVGKTMGHKKESTTRIYSEMSVANTITGLKLIDI